MKKEWRVFVQAGVMRNCGCDYAPPSELGQFWLLLAPVIVLFAFIEITLLGLAAVRGSCRIASCYGAFNAYLVRFFILK